MKKATKVFLEKYFCCQDLSQVEKFQFLCKNQSKFEFYSSFLFQNLSPFLQGKVTTPLPAPFDLISENFFLLSNSYITLSFHSTPLILFL